MCRSSLSSLILAARTTHSRILEEYPLSRFNGGPVHQPWDVYFDFPFVPVSDPGYWRPKARADGVPTREELLEHGDQPIAIVDVAIVSEYTLLALEIVHTSPVGPDKLRYLTESGFSVWEIRADDIMRSTQMTATPSGLLMPCVLPLAPESSAVVEEHVLRLEEGYSLVYRPFPDGRVSIVRVEQHDKDITRHFLDQDPRFTHVRFRDLTRAKNRMNMLL